MALRRSQEKFAEVLGASSKSVSNWERGSNPPGLNARDGLDRLLSEASPEQRKRFVVYLGSLQRRPSVGLQDSVKGQPEDVTSLTVALVSERTAAPATTGSSTERSRGTRPATDLVTVAELRQRVQELDARYDHHPSASLLPEGGRWLGQVAILRTAADSGRVQLALSAVEAEAATLMGQLVWDASQRRDHATARVYLGQAIDAARQVGDRTLESYALLRTSYVALYGEKDPHAGLDLATRAAETADGFSAMVASVALLHVAEAHALLDHERDCEQALADATTIGARIEAMDPALELLSAPQHDRIAGSCYLALGRRARAIATLEQAAATSKAGSKSRALVLANLALAHVRGHDLDGAVASLHRALDAVEANRGGGALTVLFQAGRELRPWLHGPQAQDVHDRLLSLVAA